MEPHALVYRIGMGDPELWTVLYVVAVMGACLVSGHRWIAVFGAVDLVGLSLVAVAYAQAFASLRCVYAAVSSLVLLLMHFAGRVRPGEADADEPATSVSV